MQQKAAKNRIYAVLESLTAYCKPTTSKSASESSDKLCTPPSLHVSKLKLSASSSSSAKSSRRRGSTIKLASVISGGGAPSFIATSLSSGGQQSNVSPSFPPSSKSSACGRMSTSSFHARSPGLQAAILCSIVFFVFELTNRSSELVSLRSKSSASSPAYRRSKKAAAARSWSIAHAAGAYGDDFGTRLKATAAC